MLNTDSSRVNPHLVMRRDGDGMSVLVQIATRKSALALAQSGWVLDQLRPSAQAQGLSLQLMHVVTEGDRVQDRPLYEVGGKGLFVKEIERALLDGAAELAVHSMKDLPAAVAEGLEVVAVPVRESPWDLLLTTDGRALSELKANAVVGTTSLRRQIQLREARPDLQFVPLRGNIDTRLKRLNAGDFDAIVLAEAGVRRLGLSARGASLEGALVPAIGQGVLAIEGLGAAHARANAQVRAVARSIEDADARVESEVERAVQRALGADCVTPVGAIARVDRGRGVVHLRGFLASPDGARTARAELRGPISDGAALGAALAAELRAKLG
jgi:hydroxymethylbilane synthase